MTVHEGKCYLGNLSLNQDDIVVPIGRPMVFVHHSKKFMHYEQNGRREVYIQFQTTSGQSWSRSTSSRAPSLPPRGRPISSRPSTCLRTPRTATSAGRAAWPSATSPHTPACSTCSTRRTKSATSGTRTTTAPTSPPTPRWTCIG